MKNEKETLLSEIDALIAYGKEEPTIHPDLLAYLELQDLKSMKAKLLERVGILSEENKLWLEQFKEV
jgi:hypothetical protein